MRTIKFLVLLNVFGLSLSQFGPAGQDCTPDEDEPEVCTATMNPWDSVNVAGGKVECETNFDCCLCESILCTDCEAFIANGDSSAFGVKSIVIHGDEDDLAAIECGGDSSCEGTEITGTYIKEVKCGGDRSCWGASISVQCQADEPCKFECDGDQACFGAYISFEACGGNRIEAFNVDTLGCGGDQACSGADIYVECDADKPCKVECDGDQACFGAHIEASNVEILSCKGESGCEQAAITINNPAKEFKLECGDAGCKDLVLNIVINNDITEIKEISCGSPYGCQNAAITIINNNGQDVEIETWNCESVFACNNGIFILGTNVQVEECKCSDEYGCLDVSMSQPDCLIDESIKVTGAYGQTCVWYPENDPPDVCTAQEPPFDSVNANKIECEEASDCCLCQSIICTNCDEFEASGDFAAYKVEAITVTGTDSDPSQINCGGYSSCEGTILQGEFIKQVDCGGVRSCYGAQWNLQCSTVDLCTIDCEEDMSCAEANIIAHNVKGLKCGGNQACYGSYIEVICDANEPCEIDCEGEHSCLSATIYATNVAGVKCGDNGCNAAVITIYDPAQDFEIECGDAGCKDATFYIQISVGGATSMKQISCASDNGCENAYMDFSNDHSTETFTIEKLDCETEDACLNMEIEYSSGPIEFDECLCGDVGEEDYGCEGATSTNDVVDCFPAPVPAKSEDKGNMLIENSDINTYESENVILNVTLSKMTWINVFAMFGVIIVANILFWYCCVRKHQ